MAVEERPEFTVLLGIVPDEPETGYGWIEPGAYLNIGASNLLEVHRFWEKPSPPLIRELMAAGCLWNSFMIVGRVMTLLELFILTMPRLYLSFSKIRPTLGTSFEEETVARLYHDLPSTDFSREVLEAGPRNLVVLPVRDIGWADLGEPDRVVKALVSHGIEQRWASMIPLPRRAGASHSRTESDRSGGTWSACLQSVHRRSRSCSYAR
jgi:mannose-1-phosphate guanylyltransferase